MKTHPLTDIHINSSKNDLSTVEEIYTSKSSTQHKFSLRGQTLFFSLSILFSLLVSSAIFIYLFIDSKTSNLNSLKLSPPETEQQEFLRSPEYSNSESKVNISSPTNDSRQQVYEDQPLLEEFSSKLSPDRKHELIYTTDSEECKIQVRLIQSSNLLQFVSNNQQARGNTARLTFSCDRDLTYAVNYFDWVDDNNFFINTIDAQGSYNTQLYLGTVSNNQVSLISLARQTDRSFIAVTKDLNNVIYRSRPNHTDQLLTLEIFHLTTNNFTTVELQTSGYTYSIIPDVNFNRILLVGNRKVSANPNTEAQIKYANNPEIFSCVCDSEFTICQYDQVIIQSFDLNTYTFKVIFEADELLPSTCEGRGCLTPTLIKSSIDSATINVAGACFVIHPKLLNTESELLLNL